jgi:hypothetical protein
MMLQPGKQQFQFQVKHQPNIKMRTQIVLGSLARASAEDPDNPPLEMPHVSAIFILEEFPLLMELIVCFIPAVTLNLHLQQPQATIMVAKTWCFKALKQGASIQWSSLLAPDALTTNQTPLASTHCYQCTGCYRISTAARSLT